MARNYTPGERAIILIGCAANLPIDQINNMLQLEQLKTKNSARELNERSFHLLKSAYLPLILRQEEGDNPDRVFNRMINHVMSPKPMNAMQDD